MTNQTSHVQPCRAATVPRLRGWLMGLWLLALVLGPLAAQAQSPGRRVALLIGNSAYTHERALRNPVRDAELLGGVLKNDLKFDTVQVERNLDANGMDRVLEAFAKQAEGAETVVFYYSGHGLTGPDDRRAYLLPVDARTGVPGAPRLERQAVAAEAVRERLRALRARVTLLVLDACRDGPGFGKAGTKGLARVGGANQLLVAYATEEGRVAADGNGANSPYALALANAWRQADKTVLQQLDDVADEVARQQPDQQPTREGNLRADARLVANPFGSPTPEEARRLEDEAWALCRNASNAIPCKDYLGTWPQGRYAGLANTRLRELQAQQTLPPPPPLTEAVGAVWKDCADCPDLVGLPTGRFTMGSPASEAGREADEGPTRTVTINQRLAVGRYEVTRGQFARFVRASGYKTDAEQNAGGVKGCAVWTGEKWDDTEGRSWRAPGFEQTDEHPVVCVSWNDAQAYVKWLASQSGKGYRLLSEAEWEYAARAGSSTRYSWGDDAEAKTQCGHANGADASTKAKVPGWIFTVATCDDGHAYTAPVGRFKANAFGLHDTAGNAWEWVQDVGHSNYEGAPTDGSAWLTGGEQTRRVLRGGSWFSVPGGLRSAIRGRDSPGIRYGITGFRIARTF